MILVKIEYEEWFPGSVFLDLQTLSEYTDSVVSKVFEKEQDRVDIRFSPYGSNDDYTPGLFFTIDVEESGVHHSADTLCKQFLVAMREAIDDMVGYHANKILLRVWVRHCVGKYMEE